MGSRFTSHLFATIFQLFSLLWLLLAFAGRREIQEYNNV
jgi:hypothetical protein